MELSYEEAMRRIDEYEKYDTRGYKCCRDTRFPFDIYLYRGEGKIIVVPVTKSMFRHRCELAAYCCLNDSENAINIGKTISGFLNI